MSNVTMEILVSLRTDPLTLRYWRMTAKEDPDRYGLARRMRSVLMSDEAMPTVDGLYGRLLTTALREVEWEKIADVFLQEQPA